MKGKYNLIVYNAKIRYELELKRNITVIKGASGTGKTTLYNMLADSKKRNVGVHCNMADKIVILYDDMTEDDVKRKVKECSNKIFVADEGVHYIYEPWFGDSLNNTDNYYIFISRSTRFYRMTYSIESIYYLGSEKKGNITVTKSYQGYRDYDKKIKPDIILTEDSNSGMQMMKLLFPDRIVVSASGKDNVVKVLKQLIAENGEKVIYTIVDGAAFGSCIAGVSKLLKDGVYLSAYESFEYLLLREERFFRLAKDELLHTENYCDSTEFISWERYYLSLLQKLCKLYEMNYSKSKLSPKFRSDLFISHIRRMYKDLI